MSRWGIGLDPDTGKWKVARDGSVLDDEFSSRDEAVTFAEKADDVGLVVVEDPVGRRVEVYADAKGEFRWRRIATANGEVVGDSAEGFVDRGYARTSAARENPGVEVVDVEPDSEPS